eukprot:3962041-Karenia_brevis.AAC.1
MLSCTQGAVKHQGASKHQCARHAALSAILLMTTPVLRRVGDSPVKPRDVHWLELHKPNHW